MPVWGWILIVAAVVVIGVAIGRRNRREPSQEDGAAERPVRSRVRADRSVAGEQKVAEKELAAREKSRSKLDIHPLTPEALDAYAQPLADGADRVRRQPVGRGGRGRPARHRGHARARLPRRRLQPAGGRHLGRPPDGRRELPRRTHIHLSQQKGDIGTEQQRQAFVHYRALFAKLLETEKDKSEEARA